MYLLLRNNTYHFRYVVPPEYRFKLGKSEIRQSLKTGDKREAQRRAIMLAGSLFSEIENIEVPQQMKAPSAMLLDCFNEYLEEQRLQGIRRQTLLIKKATISKLVKYIGNQPMRSYGREAAKRFRASMLACKSKKSGELISPSTFNNHLKHINAFWHWAIAEGYTSESPFKKLSISDSRKASTFGQVYSPEALKRLFSKTSYCQDRTSFKFWLPLMALHTGARLKELAQLYLDDIDTEKQVLHIRATHSDQRIKNKNSERMIPIHSALVNLGLLKRVEQLRIEGHERLFPDIPFHKTNGYTNTPSKWWAKYLTQHGYERNTGLNFHSFRHTVANELKQQGVEERYIAALLGHAAGGITHSRYGKDYRLDVLRPVVEKLVFTREFFLLSPDGS